ncbi:MAG: prephenate dehydrogenase [Flavobacteriaceae bacterium]
MNIGIIGLGLIGGSFALAARKHIPGCVLFGEDINEEHQKQALSLNLIDQELTSSNYAEMDIIILAVPVDAALERADILLDQMNDNALLMDAGSTKASICAVLELHPKRNQFLASHPIAGTEFSGPTAAFDDLYRAKAQILCETHKTRPDLLEWALQWFKNMEMKVQEMDPKEHDKHIAYVSHLSHISSFMLGKTVMEKEKDEKAIFAMAGSGFASTVRLAKSSPAMWTPIFQQNQDNILEVLKQYIANLEEFKSLMEQSNYDVIHQKMKQTNAIREILAGIK